MNLKISIIAALSENRVIGNKGQIPWHIKEDLIRFRNLTLNHVVIIGRKAFEGMWKEYEKRNKPLPKRIHIIITHNPDFLEGLTLDRVKPLQNQEIYVSSSIEKAIEKAKSLCSSRNLPPEIFIAGGGQIYEQGIKYADKLYLTIVKGNFPGDTFFPDYSEFKKVITREEKQSEGFDYTFLELQKG